MGSVIRGLVPVLATPFLPDGSLDVVGLRRLAEFQLDSAVDGIAVLGMASEGFALTTTERSRILEEVSAVVAHAMPVVAGIGATSTATALEQLDQAATGGADAVMVLPPFMVKPGPDQLVEFYADITAAASVLGVDVMVQDAPNVTSMTLPFALIVELAKLDGVGSVKIEAPPTLPKVGAVVHALHEAELGDFAVLGGQNAHFVLEEYALGAVGTMPASEFSDLLRPVLDDWKNGRRAQARASFGRLLPLIDFGLQPGIAWAVHKEILVCRGIIEHATVRLPARPLTADVHALLAELVDDVFGQH